MAFFLPELLSGSVRQVALLALSQVGCSMVAVAWGDSAQHPGPLACRLLKKQWLIVMWVGSLSERKPMCHVIHPQGMAVTTCTHAGFASPVQEAGPVIMDLPKENQGNQSVPSPQKCVSVRVRQVMLCNKQPP